MMGLSLRRMLAVARKEFLHLRRDHRMRPVIFVIPAALTRPAAEEAVVDVSAPLGSSA